jgi:hypothetical protein
MFQLDIREFFFVVIVVWDMSIVWISRKIENFDKC